MEKDKKKAVLDSTGCGGEMVADGMPIPGTPAPQTPEEANILEGLTDLSQEDINLLSNSGSFAETSDNYSNVEEPHLLFDTKQLFERLRPLVVVVKDRQELVSKVIMIKPMGSYVLFRVNTGEIKAQVRVDLLNTSRSIERDYVVDFKALFAVIKNSGAKFLIKDLNGSPVISVLGGDVEFESYNLERVLFESEAFETNKKAQMAEGGSFQKFVIRAASSMALATRPEDRRVRVEDGGSISNFTSCVFSQDNVEIKDFSLRAVDLYFLRIAIEGIPQVGFYETETDYTFQTTWLHCAMPKIDTADISSIKEALKSVEADNKFTISPTHLYKVLNLIKSMVGNSGISTITPVDGKLLLSANTKSNKSLKFEIATAPPGATFKLNCPIASLISASLMLKKEPVIQCFVDKQSRMCLEGEGVRIIFGSLS